MMLTVELFLLHLLCLLLLLFPFDDSFEAAYDFNRHLAPETQTVWFSEARNNLYDSPVLMRDRAAFLTYLPHCLNRLFSAIITFIVYTLSDLNDLFRRKFIGLDLKRVGRF
jgi:hypothetical protein